MEKTKRRKGLGTVRALTIVSETPQKGVLGERRRRPNNKKNVGSLTKRGSTTAVHGRPAFSGVLGRHEINPEVVSWDTSNEMRKLPGVLRTLF